MSVARKHLVRGLGLLLLVALAGVIGFVIWGSVPLPPSAEALAAMEPDAAVVVEGEPWITFRPAEGLPTAGLILYPGGRVDPRAYAPLARSVAARGFEVVVVPMPLNLAVFASGRATDVIAANPSVTIWAVGGHSLGGAMAANFASGHVDAVSGLVLWAAYPASADDLSGRNDLAVLSVYATLDGLMTDEERAISRGLLPQGTCWVAIEGGNHAQFGAYGVQRGDNPAAISAAFQHAQIVDATAAFLQALADVANGGRPVCP